MEKDKLKRLEQSRKARKKLHEVRSALLEVYALHWSIEDLADQIDFDPRISNLLKSFLDDSKHLSNKIRESSLETDDQIRKAVASERAESKNIKRVARAKNNLSLGG